MAEAAKIATPHIAAVGIAVASLRRRRDRRLRRCTDCHQGLRRTRGEANAGQTAAHFRTLRHDRLTLHHRAPRPRAVAAVGAVVAEAGAIVLTRPAALRSLGKHRVRDDGRHLAPALCARLDALHVVGRVRAYGQVRVRDRRWGVRRGLAGPQHAGRLGLKGEVPGAV